MAALLLAAVAACGSAPQVQPEGPRLVERSHESMGAVAQLTAWTEDEPRAVATFDLVFRELERLETAMSTWRPESEVSRLNAAAGRSPVVVSQDVFEALRAAREASEATGGAFDVTFGALSGIWKFDHDQDDRIPSASEIEAKLPLVDYRDLRLDRTTRSAFLARPGMRAHLGGVGKGYAVDRGAGILRAHGLRDFMIQFGGDLYVSGTRGGRPWRLGIRDPRGPADRIFAAIDLTDAAFSTSGDYERYFEYNGRRYHHITDPRTGEPSRGTRSVTIVAPDATTADLYSTGVFVLGPTKGMELIERLPTLEAVIVSDSNEVLISAGLRGRLELLGAPTR